MTPPVLEKQKNMTDRDAEQKMKMKTYADQKLGVKERHSSNQATKTQQAKPPVQSSTSKKNGSMVTTSDGNQTVTRSSSMFKVAPSHIRHT